MRENTNIQTQEPENGMNNFCPFDAGVGQKLKHFATLGLYPFYTPEFDNATMTFMGYTPQLCVENGEEFTGEPLETIDEAFYEAIKYAENAEKLIEENKPLVLF